MVKGKIVIEYDYDKNNASIKNYDLTESGNLDNAEIIDILTLIISQKSEEDE